MKRNANILLLSALFVVAACTMEEQYTDNDQSEVSEALITLQASRESDPETRTVRDESNGDVLWAPGDAISLFYGSGSNGGSKFTSNATENSKITNFTGTITAITGGGEITPEATYFWGVYPYNDDVSCDGTTVTMTLPTEQVAVPGTFAPNTFPSIGRSQGLIMGFYNICGGWRFSVTKEGVRKVTLKSNGGEMITGKVKVGLNESGVPKIQEIIDGSDEVVIECPRGEYFEVGKNYYMIMLPTVFTSGFTMTFETYTEEGVYNRTAKTTISRSKFSGIANLDNYLTTPYTQKTGNIPVEDANFKAYLIENFDGNGDGEISYEEAEDITKIVVFDRDIPSIQGIECMPNLSVLECVCIGLKSVDLSGNPKLSIFSIKSDYNFPTALSISSYRFLFYCGEQSADMIIPKYRNEVSSLDLSNNPLITIIDCGGNQLTSLDISKNPALTLLSCNRNQLTSLDASNNPDLTTISCNNNQLTNLDVSQNIELVSLDCYMNQLSFLDVSSNISLTTLECRSNYITNLDVSNNRLLSKLYCGQLNHVNGVFIGNQLTNLDVSMNTALTELDCSYNQLTSLDLSNNSELIYLRCDSNRLTSLNVSNNKALASLSCDDNQLKSLDVSKNTTLTDLYCNKNQLTNLDVSKNTTLTSLNCGSNQLACLDISKNMELKSLSCHSNQLTNLDVSKNTELLYMSCYSNQLTNLDVSKNTELTRLLCNSNQLTSLDISKNTKLTSLNCGSNQLACLDISKNTKLTSLDCSPMNTLSTLYIYQGQTIPRITTDRDANYIPSATQIVVKPESGGSEGTGDEELNP